MVSNSCSQTWHTLAWMFCLVPWAGPAILIFLKRRRFFFNQLDAGSQLTMLLFIFLFIYLFIYIFIVFCSWHAKYVYVYVKKTKQCRGNLNPYSPASIQWLGPPCQLHLQHEKQNHHVYMANNWKKKRVTAGEVDTWGKELGKCTHQWTTSDEKITLSTLSVFFGLPPSRLSSSLLLSSFCCCLSFFFNLTKTLSVEALA